MDRILTAEELNKLDKEELVARVLSMQNQMTDISSRLDFLTEQIVLMNQRHFGKKSDKLDSIDGQMSFANFNEPEALAKRTPEPSISEVTISSYKRSKRKGKREEDLDGLPARIIEHTIPEEELSVLFPDGYKELPSEVFKRLSVIPQTFIVDEHHVHVYASKKNDGTIKKAERPISLFKNSIATPNLLAGILHAKFVNAIPLKRQEDFFKENGVKLSRNVMANWCIKGSDYYLSMLYDRLHKELYSFKVIHADETPVQVNKDDRDSGSKSYMWVYRSGSYDDSKPIVIYDYQKTRKTDHPREFLKDFSGTVVTDGYQVYHTLDKEREDISIAGCWIHAKRGFSEIVKSVGANAAAGTIALEAQNKIAEITHLDNAYDALSKEDREIKRQQELTPKVDAFFAWAKEKVLSLAPKGATAKALNYCINQEKYLRVFLTNGDVPMDNNVAERAIRPFTIGRKNWVMIDTINGAKSSAVIYSIVETAKANNLKIHDYIEHLLEEIPKHQDDTNLDFVDELLPWSKNIQEKFHLPQKS